MNFLTVQSRRIEFVRLQAKKTNPNNPAIVMLYEGLGSIALRRDFPQHAADATGCSLALLLRQVRPP
jgi:hypothetical protein